MVMRACLDCGRIIPQQHRRCVEHARGPQDFVRGPARLNAKIKAFGYGSANWQQIRRARLALDNYTCQLQMDEGCSQRATHVHLSPELQGAHTRATLDDVVSCCAHCSGVVDAPRAA
jgi:hypothetical protein